jgi:hypothetical protein
MPRFYFHLHDGTTDRDRAGVELPDLDAARDYAATYLGDSLREAGRALWNGQNWQLDVTDAAGLIYLTVHVVAVNAPAAEQIGPR